jgi:UDP-N-acetylmuramate dehydrogenase
MRWETGLELSTLTRYRIGGPAERFARVGSVGEAREALSSLAGTPHRVLGWGANVLVADRGVGEAVLTLGGDLGYVRTEADAIETGGAAGLPELVGEARRGARCGWSFLEAVPGSVGGGLRMNAGSTEIGLWDRVRWVDALTPEGELVRLGRDEANPAYRRVDLPEAWVFIAARFEAIPGVAEPIELEHRERRRTKVETQVYELPSCGSTWRNPGPPHGSAWQLVGRVGMRGAIRGGAQIAERHANFIANLGKATAADVLWLMAETRRRVREETGVLLEPEIRLWGFTPEELESVGGAP